MRSSASPFVFVNTPGIANSTAATPHQAPIGRFWNGAIQNCWNEIAQAAAAHGARLFALLNLSLADSVIAFYDAKYTRNFWRPVTAIRAADPHTNAGTQPSRLVSRDASSVSRPLSVKRRSAAYSPVRTSRPTRRPVRRSVAR